MENINKKKQIISCFKNKGKVILLKILKENISNRKGKIKISWLLVHENPEEVQLVFSKVIPVKAELNFMSNSIEYDCVSKEFDEIEDYQALPTYDVIFDHGSILFKRV